MNLSSRIFAVALLAVPPAAHAAATEPKAGCAVAIGGALAANNDEVWQRVVRLAGGKDARIAVFASAAADPVKSAESIIASLNQRGAKAEHIPVAVNLKSTDWRAAVQDSALIAKVRDSGGVYFAGGSQARITEVLLSKEGKPMLEAIRAVQQKGGVVAGSSAGAAIMSEVMFNEPQAILDMLKNGVRDGADVAPGLGFAGPGLMVDQHFLKRGRFGRLLPALMHTGIPLGVGVDENTAAIFCGREVEVIGAKGALVIDTRAASRNRALPHFNVKNAKLTYLDRGDRMHLDTLAITPAPAKAARRIDPNAKDYKPYHSKPEFHTDVLADTVVANLMGNFIDNPQREVIGLAFDALQLAKPDADERTTIGFEFRFSKGKDSVGWFTSAFGGEDYTVANIRLDVTPVKMARPLYAPLNPPAPR
ncbi:MAG: cyanophycinase [Betaproteobacteria bacterium]|nr:cyanophycinase [Betaproteobacteria bacterium]